MFDNLHQSEQRHSLFYMHNNTFSQYEIHSTCVQLIFMEYTRKWFTKNRIEKGTKKKSYKEAKKKRLRDTRHEIYEQNNFEVDSRHGKFCKMCNVYNENSSGDI